MKLLSSLFLASVCGFSSWSSSSVTQTPGVSVVEGETANISCCWTVHFEIMTLIWLKNQAPFKNERHQMPDEHFCSYLTFRQATRNDSGTYICKVIVDAPNYDVFKGNGTVITVTARDNANNSKTGGDRHLGANLSLLLPVIISLAAVSPLFIVALVCFCTLRRKRAQAARVIYEVPHIDSEVADMDKNSTGSSRGSSQWCQVTVYESLDYFERVQTKESG